MRHWRRSPRAILALLAFLPLAAGCAAASRGAPFEAYQGYEQPASVSGVVTAYFLGASSILLKDDQTAILIDGFVSRARFSTVLFGRVRPDLVRIDTILKGLEIDSLAAVVTTHSDYDHAMDAPAFARRTGARLLGSRSSWWIGVGGGLDTRRMRVMRHGDTARVGRFELTFLRSAHGRPFIFPGRIKRPVHPPAWAGTWRSDTVYAVLVKHGNRRILINASAEFDSTALARDSLYADVVYLASSGLSRRRSEWVARYWRWMVHDRGACRVVLVHWDNFFRSLDRPLQPMGWPLDSFGESMERVLDQADRDSVDVQLPVFRRPADPFAGLEFPAEGRCRAPRPGRR